MDLQSPSKSKMAKGSFQNSEPPMETCRPVAPDEFLHLPKPCIIYSTIWDPNKIIGQLRPFTTWKPDSSGNGGYSTISTSGYYNPETNLVYTHSTPLSLAFSAKNKNPSIFFQIQLQPSQIFPGSLSSVFQIPEICESLQLLTTGKSHQNNPSDKPLLPSIPSILSNTNYSTGFSLYPNKNRGHTIRNNYFFDKFIALTPHFEKIKPTGLSITRINPEITSSISHCVNRDEYLKIPLGAEILSIHSPFALSSPVFFNCINTCSLASRILNLLVLDAKIHVGSEGGLSTFKHRPLAFLLPPLYIGTMIIPLTLACPIELLKTARTISIDSIARSATCSSLSIANMKPPSVIPSVLTRSEPFRNMTNHSLEHETVPPSMVSMNQNFNFNFESLCIVCTPAFAFDNLFNTSSTLSSSLNKTLSSSKSWAVGVFISSVGHILTCSHVIQSCSPDIVIVWKQKIYSPQILFQSKHDSVDLGILQITPDTKTQQFPYIKMQGNIQTLVENALQSFVYVVGYPIFPPFDSCSPVVTKGRLSILTFNNNYVLFQPSGTVLSGNSGGPLIDALGNFLGIVSSNSTLSGGLVIPNLTFIVPINVCVKIASMIGCINDSSGTSGFLDAPEMSNLSISEKLTTFMNQRSQQDNLWNLCTPMHFITNPFKRNPTSFSNFSNFSNIPIIQNRHNPRVKYAPTKKCKKYCRL